MPRTKKKKWYQQRSSWMAFSLIAASMLPAFELSPNIVTAVTGALAGLCIFFVRQAIEGTVVE